MIAADMHIHQTTCLDKCNRIVSNFIASPSFRCIYVMTQTLNPAVKGSTCRTAGRYATPAALYVYPLYSAISAYTPYVGWVRIFVVKYYFGYLRLAFIVKRESYLSSTCTT